MEKVSERKEKSLPVHNFASGNVGALAFNIPLFDTFQINVAKSLPEGFRLIADAIQLCEYTSSPEPPSRGPPNDDYGFCFEET